MRNRQEESEDSLPATASLARRLLVQYLAKDEVEKSEVNQESIGLRPRRLPAQDLAKGEVEKSEANRESINLQTRRLPAQLRAKREVVGRGGKAPMLSPVGNQGAVRLRLLSAARDNQNAERKRERELRRQGRNNFCKHRSGSGMRNPEPLFV